MSKSTLLNNNLNYTILVPIKYMNIDKIKKVESETTYLKTQIHYDLIGNIAIFLIL